MSRASSTRCATESRIDRPDEAEIVIRPAPRDRKSEASGARSRGGAAVSDPGAWRTKDSIQLRSTMKEWIEEDEQGTWSPMLHHYMRHLRRAADDEELLAAMARNESIHVHYYDNLNCHILLEHAVSTLGYSDYLIEHTPNHKDCHFILFN